MRVDVKWGREKLEGVEVDLSQPPLVFKTQLYTLTDVPPENQRVMVKGKMVKDDCWGPVKLKDGQTVLMMGSVDADRARIAPPKEKVVFVEDLPEDQQDLDNMGQYGAGLTNMGNTCYMNSTLQCLYSVPELRTGLTAFREAPGAGGINPGRQLALAAGQLFGELDASSTPVVPMRFLMTLRSMFPRFAEVGEGGAYKQQDAEECMSQVMQTFRGVLKVGEGVNRSDLIDTLFGFRLVTKLKCAESEEEIVVPNRDMEIILKCNIPVDPPVNHLHEGLEQAMKADREQMSEKLGRNVLFQGSFQLAELPPYAMVQVVRFFYKTGANVKAKILKKVSYPLNLDLFNFCTEALQEQLKGPRARVQEERNKAAGGAPGEPKKEPGDASTSDAKMEEAKVEETKREAVDAPEGGDTDTPMAEAAGPSAPSSNHAVRATEQNANGMTGTYELQAVVTHKGRSADSGHYETWVKKHDGQWVEFDDDTLTMRKEEDITKLNGGGDWHMAILLVYKAQRAPEN
ncbi:unnamed protein product [Ostreobium quekettii]|uniref:Ubiquitin carboxyl-terminal hydrolase n=1 Tax=Ostreobium quekettii TaxID=121088 RepID=A0A8S1IKA4_9CHLO|nr:unnamed protein product [Ostreobium quekettii]CAD7702808.1 unnamed protein product [Ostreobium quekettii]|eukprot:evm.model.scf_73.4 EVM.evm.TU.scf_73.4   scf_73:22117-27539(+)